MKPVLAVFDDFFYDADRVYNEVVVGGRFEPFVSPWDDVTYPGINKAIPAWIEDFMITRLEEVTGEHVDIQALFARVTSNLTGPAPHRIHSDKIMAQHSAHVYLSKEWPFGGGTSFWTHNIDGPFHDDNTDTEMVMRDSHDPDKWTMTMNCHGKFNRLLIHDARCWHSAEPVGGWGESPADGRVVLTCFFNTTAVPVP